MSGWIKLHRKINDNPVLKKSRVYSNFEAFIWLLLKANYDNAKVVIGSTIYKLKKGEMITSLKKLQKQFGWGNSRLNTFLKLLKDDGMIDYKSNTQLTLITISNYKDLQGKQTANKLQPTHKQTATKSQPNTNKKNKEEIKKNKEKDFIAQVNEKVWNKYISLGSKGKEFRNKYKQEMLDDFCNYWTEKNSTTGKMKFEMEKTFDISRRLARWHKYSFQFNSKLNQFTEKDDVVEKRYQDQMRRQRQIDANAPSEDDFNDISNIIKSTFKNNGK